MALYTQTPACGYQVGYSVWYEDLINAPGNRFQTAPVEALFRPST